MEEKTVHIPSISCGHCMMTIKNELGFLADVVSVEGDVAAKTVTIKWNAPLTWESIEDNLKEIGYAPDES
ncbi:heavy-metal-associated domain-containing protein [Candidatus Latescibacterota bacterium]